jgi:hypothetical protein
MRRWMVGFAGLAEVLALRGLTFELSGRRRQDARPGLWRMYRATDRAWWLAVGAPLERGVRPRRGQTYGLP